MSIYTCVPINKTAALVTNQSGCKDPENETNMEKLERLRAQLGWVKISRDRHPKNSKKYKSLGKEIHEINNEISILKNKTRGLHAKERGLAEYISDVCKSRFNKHEWNRITEIARQVKNENDKKAYTKIDKQS